MRTKTEHVTPVGGNVFADLGFDPKEAAALKAEAARRIDVKLAAKEELMTSLITWIEEKDLKQADAAAILGISRPRVSDVQHKKYFKFSVDSLLDMVSRTGKHVQLSIQS